MTMTLKTRLAEPGRLMSVHVCVIPSAVVTQAIAAAGADAVIIDQKHGPIWVRYASRHDRGNAGNRLRSLGSRAGDQ